MKFGGERAVVQTPFIRYAVEAGWTYLSTEEAREATEHVIAAVRELKRSLMRHLFTYGSVPLFQADQVELQETEIGPIPAHWEAVPLGSIQTEQREIACILSAVDARIAAEEARRAALDALFHTLLHHLMMGKIRATRLGPSNAKGDTDDTSRNERVAFSFPSTYRRRGTQRFDFTPTFMVLCYRMWTEIGIP